MNQTFNQTFNNYADAEKRLAFYSVKQEYTSFTEGQKIGDKGKLGTLDFGSEPKFIFFLVNYSPDNFNVSHVLCFV